MLMLQCGCCCRDVERCCCCPGCCLTGIKGIHGVEGCRVGGNCPASTSRDVVLTDNGCLAYTSFKIWKEAVSRLQQREFLLAASVV